MDQPLNSEAPRVEAPPGVTFNESFFIFFIDFLLRGVPGVGGVSAADPAGVQLLGTVLAFIAAYDFEGRA